MCKAFNIPNSIPEQDPTGIWSLQKQLMTWAENLVGPRDPARQIYQPVFHEFGPRIRNTPSFDGAFAELGPGGKRCWPTVVYELAHETIHLLNPVAGHTNWLEEGVAVEFSIYAQLKLGLKIKAPRSGPYREAMELVRSLRGGVFASAHRIRSIAESLSEVTFDQLHLNFADDDRAILKKLSEECVPR